MSSIFKVGDRVRMKSHSGAAGKTGTLVGLKNGYDRTWEINFDDGTKDPYNGGYWSAETHYFERDGKPVEAEKPCTTCEAAATVGAQMAADLARVTAERDKAWRNLDSAQTLLAKAEDELDALKAAQTSPTPTNVTTGSVARSGAVCESCHLTKPLDYYRTGGMLCFECAKVIVRAKPEKPSRIWPWLIAYSAAIGGAGYAVGTLL